MTDFDEETDLVTSTNSLSDFLVAFDRLASCAVRP